MTHTHTHTHTHRTVSGGAVNRSELWDLTSHSLHVTFFWLTTHGSLKMWYGTIRMSKKVYYIIFSWLVLFQQCSNSGRITNLIYLFILVTFEMSSLFWLTSFPSLHILDLSLVAEEASSSVPGLSATGSSLTLAGLSPSLLPYIKGHGVKITAKITQLKSRPANKPHICFSSQLLEAQVDSSCSSDLRHEDLNVSLWFKASRFHD